MQALEEGNLSFLQHLGPLDVSPVAFLSQTFWGLVSSVQLPGLGCLMCGTNPSLLQEKHLPGEIPPYSVLMHQGWVLMWSFYPLL